MVFRLQNGQYGKPTVYSVPDIIPVGLFDDFLIPLTTYAAGLRVSETANLRVGDIDSK
ncbi:hypothetical protein [Desulfosporosinus sp. I2]|uniref:hypothetical protein n=1 Tax=Desulfosporosinus sp. I2 TaxID=1617025 RepID=UPI000ACBFFA1|nr:hypothetical protein [Desulfosporosinus sp. I2]